MKGRFSPLRGPGLLAASSEHSLRLTEPAALDDSQTVSYRRRTLASPDVLVVLLRSFERHV